ncbi:uncharacterized protein [Prorops nasuta]|uniref:uncharacterized protein n=1 Tax=Prorops nasuta TaxID=863751 RepID=UPI0034CF4D7B
MGLKAAVQALKKAKPLKDKVQQCKDLLNDNDAWACQQQLQKIYQQVLILDLEYALDRKVEQELWNLGFKNYIATLQSQAKDKKNPKRGESQALLSWCLEAASGFYLTLLQEICTAFDLDLPFRRKGYVYGCTSPWKAIERLSVPHKSSCFYACQYCLVHLGDIARYRNENKQAELFYRHAVSLSPCSGQPYNQLALLEASRGDKLGTVFHYVRSVAVKHPFPVATANLAKTLSSALNDNSYNLDEKTKLTSQEYLVVFLKLHGIIHNLGNLKLASSYVKLLTETLTALVATESFNSWRLVQMLMINLYALQHVAGAITESTELLSNEQLSTDERIARDCILDLIAGSLSALLLPVYTIKNSIVEYFALPSIKLCLDWICIKPAVLEETAFATRLQIWPSLCVLLNALQNYVIDFNHDQYSKVPLPEDRDLQGFLPLEKVFENLRFTNTDLEGDIPSLNKLRAARILNLGRCLAQYQINGSMLISITSEEMKGVKFSSTRESAGLSNELMKELEELSLNKERQPVVATSPVPSESTSSKGSMETDISDTALDKRIGILKAQVSSDRSKDSVNANIENTNIEPGSHLSVRRPRQNIAMQAIMRRAENEQKQVTFKNISPIIVEESNDKKIKAVSVPPIKAPAVKSSLPVVAEASNTNGVTSQKPQIVVKNRPPLMPHIGVTTSSQSTAVQEPTKPKILNAAVPQSIQVTSTTTKDLISNINKPSQITQFNQVTENVTPIVYSNQNFNVQNPQFAKNFMTGHLPNLHQYQMPAQFNNASHPLPGNILSQPNLNQSRMLHQRGVGQPLQPNSMYPQNLGTASSPLQNRHSIANSSGTVNLHQPGSLMLHQNLNIQQQQGMVQSNLGTNGLSMQGQIVSGTNIVNTTTVLPAMTAYQKNLQQIKATNTSLSSSTISTFPLNFSQSSEQTAFNQVSQKQLSPKALYNKNSNVDFSPSAQTNTAKSPQQSSINFPIFNNYETTEFGLWKDTQPPVTWWGSSSGGVQTSSKDASSDVFQNWPNSPNMGSMLNGGMSLTTENQFQQSSVSGRQMCTRNNFDDTTGTFEEQQPIQSPNVSNTYSLFSGNTWVIGAHNNSSSQDHIKTRLNQQSLWSGPGPSPLERLLEQQKSLREGGT